MSKEFNVYDPGKWIYADEEKFEYIGLNIYELETGLFYSQEKIALLLNEIIKKRKLKFTKDEEFRQFVNSVLSTLLDQSNEYEDKKTAFNTGLIPSEKSGVIISGHEITAAQLKVFNDQNLTLEERKTVVNIFYSGKRTSEIKQDLFQNVINRDIDYILEIMKADTLAAENIVFEKYRD